MKTFYILALLIVLVSCKESTEIIYSTYPNGNVEWKFTYPDKTDTTTYQKLSFYEDGRPRCINNYKSGKQHGEFINYFSNGKVECEWIMADGLLEGTKYEYYQTGSRKSLCNHVRGQENGLNVDWYETGKIKSIGKYIHNEKNGLWKTYEANGDYKELNYKNGLLEGPTREINSGSIFVYGQFLHNKEVGKWVWKINNRIMQQTAYYANGEYNGEAVYFHRNGKPERIGQLKNGQWCGELKYYDDKGNLLKIENYENDSLISLTGK